RRYPYSFPHFGVWRQRFQAIEDLTEKRHGLLIDHKILPNLRPQPGQPGIEACRLLDSSQNQVRDRIAVPFKSKQGFNGHVRTETGLNLDLQTFDQRPQLASYCIVRRGQRSHCGWYRFGCWDRRVLCAVRQRSGSRMDWAAWTAAARK